MTQQSASLTEIRPRFLVDTPPYMHRGYTVGGMMRDTAIALAPAAFMAVYFFGLPALRVMALAAGTCALTEALWQKILGRDIRIHDGTALITGLLFAFLLPAGAPWWLVVTGSAFAIIFGKQVFGGLGCNPLCPPLVGWAAMTVAWPVYMDPSAMNLQSNFFDPLLRMKYFGFESLPSASGELSLRLVEALKGIGWEAIADSPVPALLLGEQLGGLGSAQTLAVLFGGLYLVARKAVRWEIPLAFITGTLILGVVFWKFGEAMGVSPALCPPPHLYLLTGSTLFAAFFLATDSASSPVATGGMLLYGLIGGCMVTLIRVFGVYPDGAPFAVLVASLITPMCDLIRVAPYGKKRR